MKPRNSAIQSPSSGAHILAVRCCQPPTAQPLSDSQHPRVPAQRTRAVSHPPPPANPGHRWQAGRLSPPAPPPALHHLKPIFIHHRLPRLLRLHGHASWRLVIHIHALPPLRQHSAARAAARWCSAVPQHMYGRGAAAASQPSAPRTVPYNPVRATRRPATCKPSSQRPAQLCKRRCPPAASTAQHSAAQRSIAPHAPPPGHPRPCPPPLPPRQTSCSPPRPARPPAPQELDW